MPTIVVNREQLNVRYDDDYETIREGWNEYRMSDGVTVRLKSVAQRLARVLDENGNPARNNAGDPFVIVSSQLVVVSIDPDPDARGGQ